MTSSIETVESGERAQPLAGYRILDLTDETGAYCGKLLADLGADVIKIEPVKGDRLRFKEPFWGDTPDPNGSLKFWYMNANKRGLALDIEDPDGRGIFLELTSTADVIVESFPVGYLASIGLTAETIRAENSSVIITSITPFGQHGPYSGFKANDMIALAMGGWMYAAGEPSGPPMRHLVPLAYYMASAQAAQGTVMALLKRARSPEATPAEDVDISLQRTMAACVFDWGPARYFLGGKLVHRRWAGYDMWDHFPFAPYPCKDGYVWVLTLRPQMWPMFVSWVFDVTGDVEITDSKYDNILTRYQPETRFALRPIVEKFTLSLTKDELWEGGRERGLTITPCLTVAEISELDQLHARDYFQQLDHGEGFGPVQFPGVPYQLRGTPCTIRRPAPRLGEHRDDILRKELGKSNAEMKRLAGKRVV